MFNFVCFIHYIIYLILSTDFLVKRQFKYIYFLYDKLLTKLSAIYFILNNWVVIVYDAKLQKILKKKLDLILSVIEIGKIFLIYYTEWFQNDEWKCLFGIMIR